MLCSLQIPKSSTDTKPVRNLSNPSLVRTDGSESVQGTTKHWEDSANPQHGVLLLQHPAFPKGSSTSHPTDLSSPRPRSEHAAAPRPTESAPQASHLLRWTRFGVHFAVLALAGTPAFGSTASFRLLACSCCQFLNLTQPTFKVH